MIKEYRVNNNFLTLETSNLINKKKKEIYNLIEKFIFNNKVYFYGNKIFITEKQILIGIIYLKNNNNIIKKNIFNKYKINLNNSRFFKKKYLELYSNHSKTDVDTLPFIG